MTSTSPPSDNEIDFLMAIRQNDTKKVDLFLVQHPERLSLIHQGLLLAAELGRLSIIKALLSKPNLSLNVDYAPFSRERFEWIQHRRQEEDSLSPLLAAIHYGHLDVIRFLLEKGANPMEGWEGGALGYALTHNIKQLEAILELLIDSLNAEQLSNSVQAFYFAPVHKPLLRHLVYHNHRQSAEKLLQAAHFPKRELSLCLEFMVGKLEKTTEDLALLKNMTVNWFDNIETPIDFASELKELHTILERERELSHNE